MKQYKNICFDEKAFFLIEKLWIIKLFFSLLADDAVFVCVADAVSISCPSLIA